ncbi:hypothetical protein [Desulfonatronum parangueonense]
MMFKAVPSMDAHPVRHFFVMGVPIVINTNDPAFSTRPWAVNYKAFQTICDFPKKRSTPVLPTPLIMLS